MDILQGLNPKQKEAVEAISGPVLVVAGPGSGKTRTLTHKIAYLLSRGVPSSQILAVTFTNKAAEEIKNRVHKLLGAGHTPPSIGTFHSICARILRKDARALGYTAQFTIYDEEDALALVKTVMKDMALDQKQWSPAKVRAIISSLKNGQITPGETYESPYLAQAEKVRAVYQTRLAAHNAMDFDDLLVKTVELFEENPAICKKYQSQFHYVLVDEFQDTNGLQYKIANMIAQYHSNLYCIGDMDQSIYSFRGADYRNILRFERDWPNAKVITLEQNYRSTQNILDAAAGIIAANNCRRSKNLWTENGKGGPIAACELFDEKGEGDFIVSEIQRLAASYAFRDFVVLYRTNSQSRAIEESFLRAGIPYKIVGGIKFYQRKEIKDILAILRLCLNGDDVVARDRLHAIPTRFLQPKAGPPLAEIPKQTRSSKFEILNSLLDDFAVQSKKLKLTELLQYVIQGMGFEEYVRDGTDRGEERWDNVRELFSVCIKYGDLSAREAMLILIEEAALAQDTDGIVYEKDLVNLMTLHSAKGLEFPVVFIAGCEQGLLPHAKALIGINEELEEERRLCYVGVTRAKEMLYLLLARQRTLFGRTQSNPPSQFLRDIPEHLIRYAPQDTESVIELD